MWWKEVIHNHEMDFPPVGQLYTMETIKARKESVRVVFDMFIIVLEGLEEEFMFGVADSFDDEPVVTREVEEGA